MTDEEFRIALGATIKEARLDQKPRMSQSKLGTAAGYLKGAAVSISRIESGQSYPAGDRLARIADALGTSAEALKQRASDRAAKTASLPHPSDFDHTERPKMRAARLKNVIDERGLVAKKITSEYGEAQDRARDKFVLPFIGAAAHVVDAPQPPETDLPSADEATDDSTTTQARGRTDIFKRGVHNALRIRAAAVGGAAGGVVGSAAGAGAAYAAFTTTAAMATASTGAPIAGLSGVAASNATWAALGGGALSAGGAGMAGGAALLAGVVVAPAVLLTIGGAALMIHRNKKKESQLHAQLDELELALTKTREGFKTMSLLMPRAAEIQDHIATHGGRALELWCQHLDLSEEKITNDTAAAWTDLSVEQQESYNKFVEMTACKMALDTGLQWEQLLDPDQSDNLDETRDLIEAVIDHCSATVKALV